jgi:hypothetical protein
LPVTIETRRTASTTNDRTLKNLITLSNGRNLLADDVAISTFPLDREVIERQSFSFLEDEPLRF